MYEHKLGSKIPCKKKCVHGTGPQVVPCLTDLDDARQKAATANGQHYQLSAMVV